LRCRFGDDYETNNQQRNAAPAHWRDRFLRTSQQLIGTSTSTARDNGNAIESGM